jgi:hypothetical protein
LKERISAPSKERPELPPNTYPEELLDLINKCWDPDPLQSPSFSVVCKSLKKIKIALLLCPCALVYDFGVKYWLELEKMCG